jgi:hypothetical protein
MCKRVHVKYLLFMSDCNETWIFLDTFSKKAGISSSFKTRQVGAELFNADRRTDMTKLIVAFRNFANVPKIVFSRRSLSGGWCRPSWAQCVPLCRVTLGRSVGRVTVWLNVTSCVMFVVLCSAKLRRQCWVRAASFLPSTACSTFRKICPFVKRCCVNWYSEFLAECLQFSEYLPTHCCLLSTSRTYTTLIFRFVRVCKF